MKPLLLITGANGFVGRALCKEALAHGFQIRGATRKKSQLGNGIHNVIVGDVDDATDWIDAIKDIEVVIHLAARVHVMHDTVVDPLAEFRKINLLGTEHLARTAAACGVKRFIYVSSIKVNGEETTDDHAYSESDQPMPQDFYGLSKWEAEQVLYRISQETGLEVVIIRPPLIYGPNVKGNFAQMLNIVSRGIPLPFGSVKNQRDLIYVGNLVDVLITCATNPVAAGKTYLVSDGEAISTPDLLRHLANAMDISSRVFLFPPSLLKLIGKMTGKAGQMARLLGCLQVDSGKIRRELNWKPPYTLIEGLQKTVAANSKNNQYR